MVSTTKAIYQSRRRPQVSTEFILSDRLGGVPGKPPSTPLRRTIRVLHAVADMQPSENKVASWLR